MERKWRRQREVVRASVRPDEDEETVQEDKKRETRPPLPALSFVREKMRKDFPTSSVREKTHADFSIGTEELCNRIYGGVLLKDIKQDYKQKFWVDVHLEKNCFLLLAKKLSIIWIDDERFWGWINEAVECFSGKVDLPAAKLLEVSWLKISGTFRTIKLSPKTTYEVAFVVKMSEHSRGWHAPVNLNLTLPDGTTLGRMENLEEKQKEEWIEIFVGTFMTTPENVGKITFSFSETGGHWKSGLIVKGVVLRPKD